LKKFLAKFKILTDNKMKKVFILFLAIFAFTYAQAQVTVTLGSALLQNPGTDVHLPVTVKGLNGLAGGIGVSAIELHLAYANTSVVYDTTLNFSALAPTAQWVYGANGVEYSTNWLEPAGGKLNFPDNTVLFEIVFQYSGGATELTFDTTRCLLTDSAFNIIPGVRYVNGQITPSQGSGESRWNGTGTWNTMANWSNGIPGDSTNAIIESGTTTVLSNAVCRSVTINQGSSVIISPDYSLTANSNYTNNGNLTMQSDADGTGSLLVRGSVSGTGVNDFKRYLDLGTENPHFVSSPVSGATATVFGANVAEKYLESSASWAALSASDLLETATGYRITGTAPASIDFRGVFNTGDVARANLSYNGTGAAETRGLNLLGNPYPSAIQWEQGNWSRNGLDYAVYAWDGYKYVSWNGSIGALTDGIIPAMQGFLVKSNAAGASITIPAGSRLHSTLPYYKESAAQADMISLRIESMTDANHYDKAFVQVLNGTTTGYDGNHDAWKLFGNSVYPQIFTVATDQSILSINTQPGFGAVPVEYLASVAGSYKITFGDFGSFNPSQPLFFEDKSTQTVINIRNSGEFVFTTDGTPQTGRFVLHFQEVGIKENAASIFSAWSNDNLIMITPKTGNSHIDLLEIYNLAGQIVFSAGNLDLPATIEQENLSMGLYIMKIKTQKGLFTQKLFVR
jgi:hypothetical protein